MAFTNATTQTCRQCGKAQELKTYGSINVSDTPELKDMVKNGSLFIWECPRCGARNLLKTELLYHDPEKKLMIWLLPEGEKLAGQIDSLGEKLFSIANQLEGYTLRSVPDAGSLIEKLNISDAGLDDAVIELCKYVTKLELCEKSEDKTDAIMSAPFKFYRMQGADNEIVMSFPLDGTMQGINIGFNVYEDCSGILGRNPAASASIAGFAKIDSAWLAKFFQ